MIRIITCILIWLCLFGPASRALADEAMQWDRIGIFPSLTITQRYSDNVYLFEENTDEDYIVSIEPDVSLRFALFPENYFQLRYQGDYYHYAEADNFRGDQHLGEFSFTGKTGKGSRCELKASIEDTAIPPYSSLEQAKDYLSKEVYADVALMLGQVAEIGGDYSRRNREFDEAEFEEDDYTRTTFDVYALYGHMPMLPLLLQYRYVHHDNEYRSESARDFVAHTAFVGTRWRPERRLSGNVRIGYTWAEFDRSDEKDIGGVAVDASVRYEVSAITRIDLRARRLVHPTTKSARESGDYYELTSVAAGAMYARWDRLIPRLTVEYFEKEFKSSGPASSTRVDYYYRVAAAIAYALKPWLDLSLGYGYRRNDSNMNRESYTENAINFALTFGLPAVHGASSTIFGHEENRYE